MAGDQGLDPDSITPTALLVHDDAPRAAYAGASHRGPQPLRMGHRIAAHHFIWGSA